MGAHSRRKKNFIDFFRIYGLGILLAGVILFITYQFVEPAPPLRLTIATADKSGAYYDFATEYKELLAQKGIELNILETSGSLENLEKLGTKKTDVAFLQGGIGDSTAHPHLQGLASLYLEPLWIFTKKDGAITKISDLRGKRIAIGKPGSGTQKIARQILEDNGIGADSTTFLAIDSKEGARRLEAGDIDALFIVIEAGSPKISALLDIPHIHLLSIKRAQAYTRRHTYLSYVILPEGAIDLAKNIPDKDIHLIAPAATLIIHDELHPALIDQLMQVSSEVHKKRSLLLTNTHFPSQELLDFPLSSEAKRYYANGPPFLQRYLPFWAATMVDRLKVMLLPLVALILPLIKILPPTYTWRIRSRIYRWYEELHAIDIEAKGESGGENLESCLEQLQKIEDEVRQVEVPLSYAKELYTLRHHIELLRQQIKTIQ